MEERISLRRENTKTFDLGKGRRRLEAHIGAIHYKDNYADPGEAWKDIDLTWEGNRITRAPYEMTLDGKKLTLRDKKTGEVSTIELLESKPSGLKWEVIPEFSRVSFRHILPSDKIPFEAKFKVTGNVPFGTRAWDDEDELPLEVTLQDGVLTEKLSSLPRPAKGEIRVDPTWQVGASTDDCGRFKGGAGDLWGLTWSEIPAGQWYAPTRRAGGGARFTSITIPQGTTIGGAYLTLRSYSAMAGTVCNTRISAERVDNAPTFADNGAAFDTRWANRTTARVDWDSIAAWTANTDYNSPEIKTVIQEIISRAGWASGNALVVFWEDFEGRSSTYAMRQAYSYNGSTTYAPKLVIEYAVFPSQYSGLRAQIKGATQELCLVAAGDGATGMGGIPKMRKGATTYDIYLVETGDPDASAIRIKTTTGIKAVRKKT